jgi:hypothetical protein
MCVWVEHSLFLQLSYGTWFPIGSECTLLQAWTSLEWIFVALEVVRLVRPMLVMVLVVLVLVPVVLGLPLLRQSLHQRVVILGLKIIPW